MQQRTNGGRVQLVFRIAAVATLFAAFGQVTLGGVVRVTSSGLGCPDWPLCHGRIVPPLELPTIIEYSHRLSASVLGVLLLLTASMAWLYYRSNHRILVASLLGLVLGLVAAGLGGATVLTELLWWVRLFHLGIAEVVVACMVVVAVGAWTESRRQGLRRPSVTETGGFNLIMVAAVLGTFVLILSGSYMVGYGAGASCATWPLCRGSLFPDGTPYAIHMGHRFLAGVVGLLIIATVRSAWSRSGRRPELAWGGLVLTVVFTIQVLAGAAMVWAGFPAEIKALHLSLATLVWGSLFFLATLALYPRRLRLPSTVPATREVSEPERLTP